MVRLFILLCVSWSALQAQEDARREIPTNFAPAAQLQPALQSALSPSGRFVLLPDKGTVLVIDHPARIDAAEQALRALKLAEPILELHVGVRTGGTFRPPASPDPFLLPAHAGRDVPFPIEFSPPRLIVQPNGSSVLIPATPTRFGVRSVGTTLTSSAIAHADGTVHVDLSFQNVAFAGFVPYGAPRLPFGTASSLPLQPMKPCPSALVPFLHQATAGLPVLATTRISTSVLVFPTLQGATTELQILPQLSIESEPEGATARIHAFREYRTNLTIKNGKVTTLRGFRDAPDAFNEGFFGDQENPTGKVELVLKGQILPGTPAP